MASEDVLAREDAQVNLDGSTPMALEAATHGAKPRRRGRLTAEEKLAREQEKARVRAERAQERERAKLERAEERVRAKALEAAQKLAEAQGGLAELPAVVLRDGTVRSVSLQDAVEVISLYLSDLCLDIESSGYWIGHRHYELRTIQLGGEEMAVVLDAADERQLAVASWALKAAVKLRAHSATADVIPCVHAGLIGWEEAWGKMHDSVLNAKLSDPKMSGSDADALKRLAADLLGLYAVSPAAEKAKDALFTAMKTLKKTDVTTPPERNGWHQVDKRAVVMIRYAGSDVLDLAAVLRVLPPLPVGEEVLDRERRVQGMCARSAYWGFPLDYGHVKGKIAEYDAEQAAAQERVAELTGGTVTNPSSSAEVLAYLTEHGYQLKPDRKTKQPSAGKASLEPFAARGDELAKNILEYRHDTTTLGLLLRPLENLCTEGDAIMRPTVYTINAVTGRMSCVRPNSQQFSRQGGIRACVRAWDGYLGISADFSGCEIVVAAALSGDKGLYEAETSSRCHSCKEDPCACGKHHTGLHWLTAHTAKGIHATKEDRYNAKRCSFTKLFGGSPGTAADQIGSELRVAEEVFEAFSSVAPAYTAWDTWLKQCYEAGSLVWRDYATGTNYSQPVEGSRRLVYRAYSGRQIYVTKGSHAAGNGSIQGTARELLVDGLLRWNETRWGHLPVLPVHDQLICFVKAEEAEEATQELARCMSTDILSSPGFAVHVGVDTDEPFASWGDSS